MAATAASRAGGRRSACPVQVGGRVDIEQHAWIIHLDQAQTRLPEQSPRALVRVQQRQPRQQVRAESHGMAAPSPMRRRRHRRMLQRIQHARHAGVTNPGHVRQRHQHRARRVGQASRCRAAVARLVPMPSPAGSASITRQSSVRSSAASAALPGRTTATTLSTAARSRRALATATHGPCGKGASSLSAPAARRSASPARRQQDAGTRGRQVG